MKRVCIALILSVLLSSCLADREAFREIIVYPIQNKLDDIKANHRARRQVKCNEPFLYHISISKRMRDRLQ